MFETGESVEVATEDRPDLVFDATGTVVGASLEQGYATVRLSTGEVEMFNFRRLRPAADD